MTRLDGIDTSHYQILPDWAAVHDAGVFWACVKATQAAGYVDPTFMRNWGELRRAGFRHQLAYHWINPTATGGTPAAQAAHFISIVGGLSRAQGAMVDAEYNKLRPTDPWEITEAEVYAFCVAVEDFTHRPTVVYSSPFVAGGTIWRSARLRASKFGPRPFITASYTAELTAKKNAAPQGYDAWQFSGTGTCPGVTGACDLDQIDNPAAFDVACGLTAPVVVAPPSQTPTPILEDDMSNVLYVSDPAAPPAEQFAAQFFAVANSSGAALEVRWTGPGTPQVLARIEAHKAAGLQVVPVRRGGFINCDLVGPIPPGFTPADFASVPA